MAVGVKDNDFALYLNNSLVEQLSSGLLPQGPGNKIIQLRIGQFINTDYLNGHIQTLGYYPTRLTNLQLSEL
jgi:hypothetical protein